MDNLTKEQRRRNMQNIRSKGTIPERLLMRALRREGIYFASYVSTLAGKPDIVFRRLSVAVFVDSDFWHKHPSRFIMPKSNQAYWKQKIRRNVERDKRINKVLRSKGWTVIRVWEYDIKHNFNKVFKRLSTILRRKLRQGK